MEVVVEFRIRVKLRSNQFKEIHFLDRAVIVTIKAGKMA